MNSKLNIKAPPWIVVHPFFELYWSFLKIFANFFEEEVLDRCLFRWARKGSIVSLILDYYGNLFSLFELQSTLDAFIDTFCLVTSSS